MKRSTVLCLLFVLSLSTARAATPEPQQPTVRVSAPQGKEPPVLKPGRLARLLMSALLASSSVSGVGDLPPDLEDILVPRGGSHGGNGGGRGEQNLVYAAQNFRSFIERCLHTEGCTENAEEVELLMMLGREVAARGVSFLRFETESEKPLRWRKRAAPALLELGNLYVNKDNLLVHEAGKEPHPMDVSEAATLIVRSCIPFYDKADELAARFLATQQKTKPEELALTQLSRDQIRLVLLEESSGSRTRFTLFDDEHALNLTDKIWEHALSLQVEPDAELERLHMNSFVWDKMPLPASNQQKISATGNLSLAVRTTVDGKAARIHYVGQVIVSFALSLRDASGKLMEMTDGWWLGSGNDDRRLKVVDGSTRIRLKFQTEGYTEYLSCEDRLSGAKD